MSLSRSLALCVLPACTLSAPEPSPNNPARAPLERAAPSAEATASQVTTQLHQPRFPGDVRSLDGSGNNLANPTWGAIDTPFLRLTEPDYDDDLSEPGDRGRPNVRAVSNACSSVGDEALNRAGVSDMLWQWGQFLDHDIDLTPEVDPEESYDVDVPTGDPWFDPLSSGTVVLPMHRSSYAVDDQGVRQQINVITAWVDASNVYGSDAERADALRLHDGSGKLRTSEGDMLPFNTDGLPNAAPGHVPPETLFLAGDFRANEQVGLTAMHTLFVREHNRLVDRFSARFPGLTGDQLYFGVRAVVGAEMQAITYREFLPLLLGPDPLAPYDGYDPSVDPSISNEFATAAYRLGHSMLSPDLLRVGRDLQPIEDGPLSLAAAFFAPQELMDGKLDALLRGLTQQQASEMDPIAVDEVRNFLFGPPGAGGLDLISLNLQRGREHGLADYARVRSELGLSRPRRFSDIHPDRAERLASVYDDVGDIDLWVGLMAEPPSNGGMMGETARRILVDQFTRLRDGDAFWYERYLPQSLQALVENRTLAVILAENTDIGAEVTDPWHVPNPQVVDDPQQDGGGDGGGGGGGGGGQGGPGGGGGGQGGPGGGPN